MACVLALSNDDLFALTKIDPWFLEQIRDLIAFEQMLAGQACTAPSALDSGMLWQAKELGIFR